MPLRYWTRPVVVAVISLMNLVPIYDPNLLLRGRKNQTSSRYAVLFLV
jgi:hypothetical protein